MQLLSINRPPTVRLMCGVHQLSRLCPRHGTDRHTTGSGYVAQRIPVGQCHCCCVVQSCHQIQRYQHRTTTHASTCRGDPRVIVSWSIMSSTRHMQVLILVLVLAPPLQQQEQRSSSVCTPVLALTCEVVHQALVDRGVLSPPPWYTTLLSTPPWCWPDPLSRAPTKGA